MSDTEENTKSSIANKTYRARMTDAKKESVKAADRKRKNNAWIEHAMKIASDFPPNKLMSNGGADGDHSATNLNLPADTYPASDSAIKQGSLTMDLRHDKEGKLKIDKEGLVFCAESERLYDYLDAVYSSLIHKKIFDFTHTYLRVQATIGTKTRLHTDTMRAATPNAIMIHEEGFQLKIHLFPSFKCSLVKYQGRVFIPFSIDPDDGITLIGCGRGNQPGVVENDFNDSATYYVIPLDELKNLKPYFMLPHIVVGIKDGKLQVIPMSEMDQPKVYGDSNKPLSFEEVTFRQVVMTDRTHVPRMRKPPKRTATITKPNVWHKFNGWQHAHEVVEGSNCDVPRTHVFHEFFREHPASSNVVKRLDENASCKIASFVDCRNTWPFPKSDTSWPFGDNVN
jgi:hypothetical protein